MNTSTRAVQALAVAALASLLLSSAASARPVLYTLRTVMDGEIGGKSFSQALIVIKMRGDTSTVESTNVGGHIAYVNQIGHATISISSGARTVVAHFAPGEVFVRYDPVLGVAGFGSSISPLYPFALGCDNFAFPSKAAYTADCTQGDWGPRNPTGDYREDGTANMLAAVDGGGLGYPHGFCCDTASPALAALPRSLTQSTVLTGRVHACAVLYSVDPNSTDSEGNLTVCPAKAPRGLRTDRGGLYIQDSLGGSPSFSPYWWDSWYQANGAVLQVEVLEEEED
jgi:hypothetical protein